MTARPARPWWPRDLAALAAYLLVSCWVFRDLLAAPRTGYLSQGVQDQQAFEWYFGASAHNVLTLSNPLFSDRQNVPDGVNLMANAAMVGIGVPLTPLTQLAGASMTFLLVMVAGMTLTAGAWWWLFTRRLALAPAGAFVGGLLAAFSPGMVSHANGHPNFVVHALVPLIVDRVIALARHGRTRRDGVALGLLVAAQVFVGEEVLLLAAIGIALVGLVPLVRGQVDLRRLVPGVALGALVCLVIVGYPLWWQFAGPQSYTTIWHPPAGNDLAALWGSATRSIGADPWASAALSMNRTEENAFLGPLLWPLALALVVALRRHAVALGLGLLVVVATWLSLGEQVTLHGEPFPVPSLWALAERVPVLENVLPTRFALLVAPAMGWLVAMGVDAAGRSTLRRQGVRWRVVGRPTVLALAALALVPVVPTPLVVEARPPVPAFFADGTWRRWVDDGSVLAVPPTDIVDARAMEWQDAARMGFPIVEGYFVGPGPDGVTGQYGATRRPLSQWLAEVAASGVPRAPSVVELEQFEADLRAWRTDAVVLPERAETQALLHSLTPWLGQPEAVGGVSVWDVRARTR